MLLHHNKPQMMDRGAVLIPAAIFLAPPGAWGSFRLPTNVTLAQGFKIATHPTATQVISAAHRALYDSRCHSRSSSWAALVLGRVPIVMAVSQPTIKLPSVSAVLAQD